MTADVDSVFEPKMVIYEAARQVASGHPGLPEDWLNDGVKGLLPPGADQDAQIVLDLPGITVSVPPSRCRPHGSTVTRTTSDSSPVSSTPRALTRCSTSSLESSVRAAFYPRPSSSSRRCSPRPLGLPDEPADQLGRKCQVVLLGSGEFGVAVAAVAARYLRRPRVAGAGQRNHATYEDLRAGLS